MYSARKIVLPFVALCGISNLYAQDSTQTQPAEKTSFNIGINYASKLHYFGRQDSLKSTALIPGLSVQFGNGVYLSSSVIFINNNQQSVDYAATVAGGGIRFGESTGFAGSIYADKFFYANNSLVQASQKGQAGFSVSHLNKVLDVTVSGSTVFSDKSDYFAAATIDHPLRIQAGKSVFVIVPTFTANAGTQQFTKSYYKTRNLLGIPAGEERVTESSRRFQVLSYEASLPIVYVYNRLSVSVTPGYVLPQNVIAVDGRPDLVNDVKNLFYANAGISIRLGGN